MKKFVLSAAFAVIGTFAMAQQTQMPPMRDQQDRKEMMQQKKAEQLASMKSELNLTDAQVVQIKALHDKKMAERKANAPQMQAERKAKMEAMKAKKEQWNAEMKQILTPAQYQKWEAKRAEKMQFKHKKMQHTPMKKMPAKASS